MLYCVYLAIQQALYSLIELSRVELLGHRNKCTIGTVSVVGSVLFDNVHTRRTLYFLFSGV